MDTIKFKVSDLIRILERNRANHKAVATKAREGFRSQSIK
jgi:hypothetical protein